MKASEYLWRYQKMKAEKDSILHEMDMILIDEALPKSPSLSDDSGHGGSNDTAFAIHERIRKRQSALAARVQFLDDKMFIIRDQIRNIEDGRFIRLLDLRYVEGLKLEDVAKKMNYSHDTIRHMHGDALTAFVKANQILR